MTCPSPSVFEDFIHGRVSDQAALDFEGHVDSCDACAKLLAELARAATVNSTVVRGVASGRELELAEGVSEGRYVLLHRLGRGGMGLVHAAYDTELERKVALKFVRIEDEATTAGRSSAHLLREAQVTAQVNHPNVVQVFDRGVWNGHVFVSMEIVEGGTLRSWLSKKRRRSEVIEMFLGFASGLAAAHSAGLVHGDVKPDNVLVGKDGRPRLSDFGLASRRSKGPSPDHGVGRWPREPVSPNVQGTPAYMAPEQLGGEAPTPASDQYGFCVSLHEALRGERPASDGTVSGAVSGWLGKLLSRGLSPEPAERYPSMDSLIVALGRKPGRVWLRGAVAAAVLAASAGGFLVVQQQRPRCDGAEEKLAGVWDAQVKSKAQRAFEATRLPYAEQAWKTSSAELDAYARLWTESYADACLATRHRGDQSERLMDLRMACLVQRLQDLKSATQLLEGANERVVETANQIVAAPRAVSRCNDVALLSSVNERRQLSSEAAIILKRLADARVLVRSEDGPGAIMVLQDYVEWAGYQSKRDPSLGAEFQEALGTSYAVAGFDAAAEKALVKAYRAATLVGLDEVAYGAASQLVETVGVKLARPREGFIWLEVAESLAARKPRGFDDGSREYRTGLLLESIGNYAGAHSQFRSALGQVKSKGCGSGLWVAKIGTAIARVLRREGRNDEALAECSRTIELLRSTVGPSHPQTLDARSTRAALLHASEAYPEAIAELQMVLEAREQLAGPDTVGVARDRVALGTALVAAHESERALVEHDTALEVLTRELGTGHPVTLEARVERAIDLEAMERGAEALAELREVFAMQQKTLGEDHPSTAETRALIGRHLVNAGQFREGLPHVEQSLVVLREKVSDRAKLGSLRFLLARALWGAGEGKRALLVAEQVRADLAGLPWKSTVHAEVHRWLVARGVGAPELMSPTSAGR